jgi:sterol desaturase/sphingolipid hydroxylase (fatty acid hydroxylase superfamily)
MSPPELPDVVQYAVPFFILAMVVEIIAGRATGRARYETRDTLASLLMGAGNLAVGLALGFISYGFLLAVYEHTALIDWGWSAPVFVLAFVLDDLRYYWYHRLAHERRWFWVAHVNHHSSQHYNLSTALRQEWTGMFTLDFLFRVPLVLLGFHPAMLVFSMGINLVYQFWIHTELIRRMPAPFEAVFNTPSHHRVHHATNPRYLDANYAGTLIIWDRLFGTFVPEEDSEPCRYGLVKNIGTFNPLRIAFHEWMAMLSDASRPGLRLRERLGYVFGPPGWSHDGSRKTTAALKADFVSRHPELAGAPGLPEARLVGGPTPAK